MTGRMGPKLELPGFGKLSNSYLRHLLDVYKQFGLHKKQVKEFNKQIQLACHKFGVFPSKSQIYEVQYSLADKVMEKTKWNPLRLSFEQFAVLVTRLKLATRRPFFPVLYRRFKHKLKSFLRQPEKSDSRFKCCVFLGGSCNPTTWRRDSAIPFLTNANISFYNPQVEYWYPKLIDIENDAKEKSQVLLFVLDPRTRGIVSMVESAFLSGQGRNLVLVIPRDHDALVDWDNEEKESRKRSIMFLTDIVEKCGIPIFEDLDLALKAVEILVKKKRHVSELGVKDGVCPVWDSTVSVSGTLMLLWELFRSYDSAKSGRISFTSVSLILQSVTGVPAVSCSQPDFSFTDLCLCYAAHFAPSKWSWLKSAVSLPLGLVVGSSSSSDLHKYELFLGGTCAQSNWRSEVAVPRLQATGISFYNPQMVIWKDQFLPYEAQARDQCSVLLFVITRDSWSTAAMSEAAHFIGKGRTVILHVEFFSESDNGGLSPSAIKDYNRGREYLIDIANRSNVPVLSSPSDAVDCAIRTVLKVCRRSR